MKKLLLFFTVILFFSSPFFSQIINDTQIINPESEIYSSIKSLQMENKIFFFTQNTPISAGEIKYYLQQLDYDNLSENSKKKYSYITEKLLKKTNLLPDDSIQFYINPRINLEGYYKTNKNIPWSHDYNFIDNLITFPVKIGFSNYVSIQSDLFLGKNFPAMQKSNNYTNIPLKVKDLEFFFPKYAYGSVGQTFEKWGYNFHIGKQGKTVGDTLTGSILYNNTFETDAYGELSLYSDNLKYTFDIVQVSSNRMDNIQGDCTDRYMYIHQYDIRLLKKFKISLFEASLVTSPFQLRFINPLIFMHQYGGWAEKSTKNSNGTYKSNYDTYKETDFCAYFASMIEILPLSNLRIYGIYNQIELQLPWERSQQRGHYYPNSIGLQIGSEYNLILQNDQSLNFGIEGVYTSPYMYIKQTPSASLYRLRTDMQTKESVYSWIGSPFGPDCLGGQFRMNYKPNNKLEYELDYVITAKGSHDFDIFNSTYEDIYSYYPSVIWWLISEKGYQKSYDELYNDAITLKLSGIPVITNQICCKASYKLNEKIKLCGKIVYNHTLNFNHEENRKENGFEFSISSTFTLLK